MLNRSPFVGLRYGLPPSLGLWAVIAVSLWACASKPPPGRSIPQGNEVGVAAGGIGSAAKEIDRQTAAIVSEAPATKPHTDAITDQTDALRVIQGQLDAATKTIKQNETDCAAKDAKIAALEDEKKSGMRRKLIALVATGLIIAAAGAGLVTWLGKMFSPVIVVGLALAGGAVAFQTVLDYALWITLGALAIGAVLLLTNTRAVHQITHYAETIKPMTDPLAIEQAAKDAQSWFTRVIVGGVRKKLAATAPEPIVKAAT